MRINSAKDDAAGQAIANRFTANIKGLTQAARNANDGISIAQTTEGALNEINTNLQRIRELTVDAANGTKSGSDLKSIQDEIGQRLSEIDRVSRQTQFNNTGVLGSTASTIQIQVGAHDGETIEINLKEISSSTLGLKALDVTKAYNDAVRPAGQTASIAANIAGFDPATDIDADADGNFSSNLMTDADGNYFINYTNDTDDPTRNGYYTVDVAADGSLTVDSLAAVQPTAGDLRVAENIEVAYGDAPTPTVGSTAAGGDVSLVKDKAGNLYVKVTNADDADGNGYYAATVDYRDGSVSVADWTTKAPITDAPQGANASPLAAIDEAISKVDSLRGELGAVQNRFQSTIANLNNTVNNLSAARSRIEDADYAVEVSNMTRAQILQQAGTSVLAQANQVPQTVLSLLR